ncbi:MAG: aminoacetone oxidase family FAD-binding enzyme [Flammeovirgaceae bacterium]
MKMAIIGGGAAGFFAAINIAQKHPNWQVTIFEKSTKLLSKVKISGGGRCNVTHYCFEPKKLSLNYPRGQKALYPIFKQFNPTHTLEWFEQRGVAIKREADNRMFPITDSSQTIIDTFLQEARKNRVNIQLKKGLKKLEQLANKRWKLIFDQNETLLFDKVLIATGSQPSVWKLLEQQLGLKIVSPVPSLFTFNCKDIRINGLMGLSFPNASIKVAGTKLQASGPLLITHWGMSGPAILRLSAWGARDLAEKNYDFQIIVNFLGDKKPEEIRSLILESKQSQAKKLANNISMEGIPKRYWMKLMQLIEAKETQRFGELSKKQTNKLIEEIAQATFQIKGKSTFKEEFVTSGGVNLAEIDMKTMQAKRFPNLYFAGEVLDIDAITGGFNFQACWSEAWVLSENL